MASCIFSRSGKSLCATCALSDHTKVWGRSEVESPFITLIGESPGAVEETGIPQDNKPPQPFIGPAGKLLRKALYTAGIPPHTCHFTNVISCRPPSNDIASEEGRDAVDACSSGFKLEIEEVVRRGCRVLVPLGTVPLRQLGIAGGVTANRGSVFEMEFGESESVCVIPTFHPSFILRGQTKQEPTWVADLEKAARIARKGWVKPKENFRWLTKTEEVRDFANKVIEEDTLLAVDIEATSLNTEKAQILCIGMATSSQDAVVIPLFRKGMVPVYGSTNESIVKNEVARILSQCRTVFQNALYDMMVLENHGMPVKKCTHDVLLLHHSIHPELPHRLGYIVSVYGETPYWKDIVLKGDVLMYQTDDDVLWTYNARDCVVLHQVLEPMLEDIEKVGTLGTYALEMSLIEPVMEMQRNGLKLDVAKMNRYRDHLKKEKDAAEAELRTKIGLPPEFNLASDSDMRWLVRKVRPPKYKAAVEALAKYEEPGSRLKRDTKKYQKLVETVAVVDYTEPLYLTKSERKVKGKEQYSTDSKALLGIQIAAATRAAEIRELKKMGPHHKQELERIGRLQLFLELHRKWRKLEKLYTTYTMYYPGKDGRVKGKYTIHGTATGRLSSNGPNMQNIPTEVRKNFVAEEGNILVQADYSNLELRVLSFVSGDDVLQEVFREGKNAHDENTKDLFGISEEDPRWKGARKAAKTYIFGRNYGGGLRGIFERVAMAVPELGLTYRQFVEADRRYRELHPMYTVWAEQTVDTVRCVVPSLLAAPRALPVIS